MKTQIKKREKKGQIGETLTWIVATILIIVIMVFFIFGSSLLGETKKVGNTFRESLTSIQTLEGTDIFLKKSLFTYTMTGSEIDKISLENKIFKLFNTQGSNLDYNETKKEILLRYAKR